MHVLILLDENTGGRLVWHLDTLAQQLEVANALMGLSVLPVSDEPPTALPKAS